MFIRLFCNAALAVPLLCAAAPAAAAEQGHSHSHVPIAASIAFDQAGTLWRAAVEGEYVVVSRSRDLGATFDEAVRVNDRPEKILADGDNRPKIAAVADGTLLVSYTQGLEKPYSGNIRFSRSTDGGRSFSTPVIVNDDRQIISHRFESFRVDGSGRIHIVWLDRRDWQAARDAGRDYTGITMYYTTSEDGGRSFGKNQAIAAHTCECCRVAMDVDVDGTPVILWRHVYDGNIRDHALMRIDDRREAHRVSHDDWHIDACPHHGAALSIDPQGVYHATWFSGGGRHVGLSYAHSTDQGRTWSRPHHFGDPGHQAGHAYVLADGTHVFLAWKEFDGQQSQVRLSQSADGGQTWSPPRTVAASRGASDHPLLVTGGGKVFVSWNTAVDGLQVLAVTP